MTHIISTGSRNIILALGKDHQPDEEITRQLIGNSTLAIDEAE